MRPKVEHMPGAAKVRFGAVEAKLDAETTLLALPEPVAAGDRGPPWVPKKPPRRDSAPG